MIITGNRHGAPILWLRGEETPTRPFEETLMNSPESRGSPDEPPAGQEPNSPPALSPSQLEGLVRLLGDESPAIDELARRELGAHRRRARPLLREAASSGPDSSLRERARELLDAWRVDEQLEAWCRFALAPDPLDLETGVCLLEAVERADGNSDSGSDSLRRQLDDLGSVLSRRIPADREPTMVVSKLNHLLFRELGIRGNRENYYEPENSFLSLVLERRLGIPISLSVLCQLVARRVGLELEGVGLPRHFILRYRSGGRDHYFDPFNGGRAWSFQDCLEHLKSEGHPLEDEALAASSPRRTLLRMLANLLNIYLRREDATRRERVEFMLESLSRIRPD